MPRGIQALWIGRMRLMAAVVFAMLAAHPMVVRAAAAAAPFHSQSNGPAFQVEMDEWPTLVSENYPGAIWWVPGNALDRENIDWNLARLRDSGIRTVTVVPIPAVKGWEGHSLEFLFPEYMEMLDYLVETAGRMQMIVHMSTCTGWNFGGPDLPVDATEALVDYDAKANQLIVRPTGREIGNAAPGGEGPWLNPLSPSAMRLYLQRFTKAFAGYDHLPAAQYHDSYEYKSQWSPELPGEFRRLRGYDLESHLSDLFGPASDAARKPGKDKRGKPSKAVESTGDLETIARVKYDYRATLNQLHLEYIRTWVEWAHAQGMTTRNQAHGAPANLLDLYALSDMPETESYRAADFAIRGFQAAPEWAIPSTVDFRVLKMASSAANVAKPVGEQRVSAEACTWLREHYHTALHQCKPELDRFFLAGVNRLFFHGVCYSPKDAPWPGWSFTATTRFDWHNTIWRDLPVLSDYVARCQSFLQQGRADNDILLYWPIHDDWSDPQGLERKNSCYRCEWLTDMPLGRVSAALLNRGYAFDYISDAMLQSLSVSKGGIQAPGGEYRAIVVPSCRFMPVETMRRLAELAESGATVLFEEQFPADVPGLANLESRRQALRAECQRAAAMGARAVKDIVQELESGGIRREALVDRGLQYVRRRVRDETCYFIVNQSAEDYDGWLPLSGALTGALRCDPMTGRCGTMAARPHPGGKEVYLQLASGESAIVRLGSGSSKAKPWPDLEMSGEPAQLSGDWRIEFIEGGPELPAPYTSAHLGSWTQSPDRRAEAFSGAARYSLNFTLPERSADEWLLDLGDVREAARVELNGKDAGTLISLPFRVRAGDYLKPGTNALRIEATNLAANRLRDMDRKGARPIGQDGARSLLGRKPLDASNWPVADSGLLGPVRLIPMKLMRHEGGAGAGDRSGRPPSEPQPADSGKPAMINRMKG
ncbi:MAG: glycosyl hydrolase [Candidatus Sumerlaeota bacterium]|nr:glycosyl hydrolase [Candidatus Sumerlaeota bacterium]